MARKLHLLILATLASIGSSLAQEAGSPTPRRPSKDGSQGPEFGNARRALEALTPEQRQRFIDNLKRWSSLPPEEKKALADREGVRRKKIADEIELAISKSGLTLEGERRALFAKRYVEERRKVEEQLRRELEEKRQAFVNEFVARLKAEFSTPDATPK